MKEVTPISRDTHCILQNITLTYNNCYHQQSLRDPITIILLELIWVLFFCYKHKIFHRTSAPATLILQNMNQTKTPTNPSIQQADLNAQGV